MLTNTALSSTVMQWVAFATHSSEVPDSILSSVQIFSPCICMYTFECVYMLPALDRHPILCVIVPHSQYSQDKF